MPHRRKPVEMNVVEMLDSTRHGLQVLYPLQTAAIDGMIDTIKNLLTEEDKKIILPIAVKDKIKKLIGLTVEEPVASQGWLGRLFFKKIVPMAEYRRRLAVLSTYIVMFIHSYK